MSYDRLYVHSEDALVLRSTEYVEHLISEFQNRSCGNYLLGISGTNGKIKRSRQFAVLAKLGKCDVDWSRVRVFLVDERYDAKDEEGTNAHLLKSSLVKTLHDRGVDFPDEYLVLPNQSLGSEAACAADYEERLVKLIEAEGRKGPDLVTLGLADDLSVASIFPEWYTKDPANWQQVVDKKIRVLCTETTMFTEAPRRICVNLRLIRQTKDVLLFIGKGKEDNWKGISDDLTSTRQEHAAATHSIAVGMLGFRPSRSQSKTASAPRSQSKPASAPRSQSKPESGGYPGDAGEALEAKAMGSEPVSAQQGRHFMESFHRSISGGDPIVEEDPMPSSPLYYILKHTHVTVVRWKRDSDNHLSFIVMGAAGDLARKKTFPSVFQLHLGGMLPTNVAIIGADNSEYPPNADVTSTEDLWEKRLRKHLEGVGEFSDLKSFRDALSFKHVNFATDPQSVKDLNTFIKGTVGDRKHDNRVFYLALPPFLFEAAVDQLKKHCWSETGYVRVIVEKPFGRDLESSKALSSGLAKNLEESQIYRIDHYLAKTMTMNILTMRFANRELGRLFHCDNVANIRITFKEDIGVQGRAGYFNNYGIIRDIMQNHLLQLLTLVAMEAPASLNAEDVRDEKVKVLKQIRPVSLQECVVGQYEGYQDDPQIQEENRKKGRPSKCPTFATAVLYLDNERWSGVPFIMKAGKALEQRCTLIRLQFKKTPPNSLFGPQPQNELIMRVQPDEAIYYKILAKTPGLSSKSHEVRRTVLDMDLKKSFDVSRFPEAYEKLIHDVIHGESHNFVRRDEVEEGWRIFDPLLQALEADDGPEPERYAQGSRGPSSYHGLIDMAGFTRYTSTGHPGTSADDFQ